MGEENKRTRSSGKKKLMYLITGFTMRDIVEQVNSLKIQREDIVSLTKSGDQYFLTYYA